MTAGSLDPAEIEVLLCDADGNLFPSEEPAFAESSKLVNRFLAESGSGDRFEPEQLRLATTGMNFRTTITSLAEGREIELAPDALERWVDEERSNVTARLARTLRPDQTLHGSLSRLGERFRLAAVSSSAAARLDACFEATGLADLFPPDVRFSAEDSLPVPAGKPDPAIYEHAARSLGIEPAQGLAIEDAVPGVQSAVAAGHPTVGNVVFVSAAERAGRTAELLAAGALAVVASWDELEGMLLGSARTASAAGGLA